MQITHPLALLFFLTIIPYFLFRRRITRRIPHSYLIITVVFLLILSLVDIRIEFSDEKREFFVVIDNSPSVKRAVKGNRDILWKILESEFGTLKSSDVLTLLTIAENNRIIARNVEPNTLNEHFNIIKWSNINESSVKDALASIMPMVENADSAGLLVLTDGGVTDDFKDLENVLLQISLTGIKTKLASIPIIEPKNTIILEMRSPQLVQTDETLIFNAQIHTNFDDLCNFNAEFITSEGNRLPAKTQLYLGDTPLKPDKQGIYSLDGNNIYRLFAWGQAPEAVSQIKCRISVESADEIKVDNTAEATCFITSGKNVLIFTRNGEEDFLSEFLTKNFPKHEFILKNPNAASANYENYLLHRLIIFSDVKADAFGSNRTKIFSAIQNAVVEGGVNFVMSGGRASFAPGGYYKTPIEELLPVHLDPNRNKKRAVVLMLDRSESMNGFIGSVPKISRVCSAGVEFLSNFKTEDACAFVSFAEKTDETGETVNLAKLSDEYKLKIAERLEILGSTRNLLCKTNLEEALKVGISKLSKRSEETKLLILFSDGSPTVGASKPEEFTDLIDSAKKYNVHISFIVAGGKNELFEKLTSKLGKHGTAEYLADNWQINEAFQKALLNAGGELIDIEKTTILTKDNKLFLEYPQLNGYARTIIKKYNDARVLLVSSKHEPLIATWMLGNTRTSAIMLPFNDFDLFWQDIIPRKIAQYLTNHFRLLFDSSEYEIKVQTEFENNYVTLRIRDITKDEIRDFFLVVGDRKIPIKPIKPAIYEAKFQIENSVIGKIVENGRTIMPISLDIPNYKEFFEISAKAKKLKQTFRKYFSYSADNEKLVNTVKPTQSKMYSLNIILLLLSIFLIIIWSILFAYISRK